MTADDYLGEVAFALRDLPWSQRRDLVAELREHLAELPSETDLYARLGEPDQYAAELRAAAGLERRRGPIAYLRARRPRNVILVVLLLVATSLAIGTAVWINRYQPLRPGNAGYIPDAHDSPTSDGIYYVYREGKRFRYGTSISNSGRFTVRVLAVPFDVGLPLKYRVLVSGPTMIDRSHGIPRPFRPFRPFDLAPGEERLIVFSGTYARRRCAPQGFETWRAMSIRYRFLWHTSTTQIPLVDPLTFVFRKNDAGCPNA